MLSLLSLSYCYLTNKIPFLDVYGDINLVGHVIKPEGLYGRSHSFLCGIMHL